MPGLLSSQVERRSVLRDQRAGPVEAIDQRGADGLRPRLEGWCKARKPTPDKGLRKGDAVIECRAIFGLHEPAGRRDAEDVQVVFDAAANEEAVTREGGRGAENRSAA